MSQDIFDAHFLKLLYAHKYMYLWVQTMLIQYVYYENKSEKFPFETPPLSCRFCEFSRVKKDNVSVKISWKISISSSLNVHLSHEYMWVFYYKKV